MINEERVILMTRLASYENKEGRENENIGNYFRSDYIVIQVMRAVAGATVAYLLAFAMYIFYNFEVFMQDIYKIDLLAYAKNILFYYTIFIICYGVVSYLFFAFRYARAKRSLRKYYQILKKLNSLYKDQ